MALVRTFFVISELCCVSQKPLPMRSKGGGREKMETSTIKWVNSVFNTKMARILNRKSRVWALKGQLKAPGRGYEGRQR